MDKKLGVNIKEIGLSKFKGLTEKTFQVNKADGKTMITPDEIKKLAEFIIKGAEQKGKNIKFMIRGLNGMQKFTLKGFDEDLKIMNEQEYFDGKVNDGTKFANFFQVQITVVQQN